MSKVEQANRYIDLIRVKSNEALLFLSLGKDSLVLLDLIYPKFDRIVCVFMYFVKKLEHINRWIGWTKVKYPKIEFVQVPHWNLTYLNSAALQFNFLFKFLGNKILPRILPCQIFHLP